MGVHQLERVEDVAQVFAHLAAVGIQDVPEAQHVAITRLVEHERPDRHQRVEPAAGLVDRLADEVGGVTGGELLAVAVRVPNWANGMAPESYQQSMTSGTRVAVSPQEGTAT